MINEISSYVNKDSLFSAKSLADGLVRINLSTSDDYRKIVSGLRENNIQFYTYQLKNERAFKVVIRNLHHSIDPKDIETELQAKGYSVRNVINILHRKTKEPLPLFFVDLEPTDNCQSIYQLQYLFHTRIAVESPLPKHDVVQCKRCQRYNHTRAYCTLPVVCVRCGGNHDNRKCTKPPEADPKCGLCDGKHTANYRGCPEYKKIMKKPNHKVKANEPKPISNLAHPSALQPSKSYAEATTNRASVNKAEASQLLSNQANYNRLEQLMEQLISQNAQILGLLTALIKKLT